MQIYILQFGKNYKVFFIMVLLLQQIVTELARYFLLKCYKIPLNTLVL